MHGRGGCASCCAPHHVLGLSAIRGGENNPRLGLEGSIATCAMCVPLGERLHHIGDR
jgi:hypothetical protein